jgi:hypothetical protein
MVVISIGTTVAIPILVSSESKAENIDVVYKDNPSPAGVDFMIINVSYIIRGSLLF